MNFRSTFSTVFKKELRELLRDKRALFFLIAPPFLLPAMAICLALFVGAQAMNQVSQGFTVAVANPEAAPALVRELKSDSTLKIVTPPKEGEDWGNVLLIVKIPPDFSKQLAYDLSTSITLTVRDSAWTTSLAASSVSLHINTYAETLVDERLDARGLDRDWLSPITVNTEQAPVKDAVGSDNGNTGSSMGTLFVPLAVTSWLVGGGLGLLIDTTVGEKERRTMESLLLTPASRYGIVTGKLGVVFLASLVVMSLWLCEGIAISVVGNMGASMMAIQEGGISISEAMGQGLSQIMVMVFYLLLLMLPFVIALNCLMMAWCTFANSYRESNLVLFLVQLGLPMLAFIAVFSLPANAGIGWYLTPLMGTIIAIRDLFSGVLMPTGLLAAVGAGLGWAAAALTLAAYIFSREWALVRGL